MWIRFRGHIYDAHLTHVHPSSLGVPVLVVGGEPYAACDIGPHDVDLLVASAEERDDFADFMESGTEKNDNPSPSDPARGAR